MKRKFLLLSVLLLFAFSGIAQVFENGIRKGMVKVKFSADVAASLSKIQVNTRTNRLTTGIASFDAVAQSTSATNMYRLFPVDARYEDRLQKHGLHLWYVVEINENTDPQTAALQFKQLKEVATAEVERAKAIAPYTVTPYNPGTAAYDVLPFNDPYLKDQWHYHNTGQSGYGNADINLFNAWTKTAGANNIIVSVHDQGVDVNHSDLKANIWVNTIELNGIAGKDDDGNGYVDDINGYNFEKNIGAIDPQYHATHVAGTIAAVNNNGKGVSGIAGGSGKGDGVKIMSMQILGGAPVEQSYVYAANNGAVISQNSWGYTEPGSADQSVLDAIDYFIAEAGNYPGSPMKGGLVIFAAGNSNSHSDWYPGYYPSVLAVASIGPEWKKASYSNYGDWVEISAPGGDQVYGSKSGVLSTIPGEQYAYLQGTSMACPHISGIAALALANRTKQLTNQELWNKLMTGAVNIDAYNADYIGQLGAGAVDASMVIKNDMGVAPAAVSDLSLTGIGQEFATLSWTIPSDNDDGQPLSFELYYSNQPLTSKNLTSASKLIIKNEKQAGDTYSSYEVDGLLGLTTYYFAITSTDRWGNVSVLSNVVNGTTNAGPSIAVDDNSQTIALNVDATASTSATHDITVLNNADGILRWNYFMRHSNAEPSFNAAALHYPLVTGKKPGATMQVGKANARVTTTSLKSNDPVVYAFTPVEKTYSDWATNIIGETDLTLTNSAAARFFVNDANGFNLTQARMYLKHDPAKGPVIVEVYKGDAPTKNNLIYAQEYSNYSTDEQTAFITLNEQLYFETGSTFWLVFHVPAGNLFPLGIGFENTPTDSQNCFMSFDLGTTWGSLEDVLKSKDFAWTVTAASYNEYLGAYLTLDPSSGVINGIGQMNTTLTADGSTLVNGSYSANVVLASNDPNQKELRIPVTLSVSGQKPNIKHINIADYGSVFIGTDKTLEFTLSNQGYGNFNNPVFSINNPQFTIVDSTPWQIKAREDVSIKIKFSPTVAGNVNGILSFTDGNQNYQISLFGVGTRTSKISITPSSQVINNIKLGNAVTANVTVKNTGAYPLEYFIPGYDTLGLSDNWPSKYHQYGYKFRTNYPTATSPITYAFQDIAATGTNITSSLQDDAVYVDVDLGFDFPYYGQIMHKISISQKGFTTFDNTVRPYNTPTLGNPYNPKGYISVLGGFFDYVSPQGKIFYQVQADRIIIQYDNVWDGSTVGESITAQMVLFSNGDIRFYYKTMGYSASNQLSLAILIEDLNQSDGILVHDYDHPINLYSGLALGFDYPGPDIITHIQNGSGILAPGASSIVKVKLATTALVEGITNRYLNVISNDPANAQTSPLIQLSITNGGTPQPVVSTDTIAFGDVFKGAVRSSSFTVKNTGTSKVVISSMKFVNNKFTITGNTATTIIPGLYEKYDIKIPTNNLATLKDWLSINYSNGTHDTIYVSGNVINAPAIQVDLTPIQETLPYGGSSSHALSIKNTGLAPLEVTAIGKQWLSFDLPAAQDSATTMQNSYAFEKHNDGSYYQWANILESGTHMPFTKDLTDKHDFWKTLVLPFPIQYFGKTYTEFKIGDNGIISFDADPDLMPDDTHIPSSDYPGTFLMPYWTFGGFDATSFPAEKVGVFYQFYDDKFIITWSYLINNFFEMGDPVSAQLIYYKNNTMKFQYRAEETGNDLTSQFTTIGLQESSTNGVSISDRLHLDYGKGLVYIVVPAKKHVVAPGTTITGQININAKNVFGAIYNESLKLQTNVPGSENLEKPIQLTVTGSASLVAKDTVDFGRKMITYQYGSPTVNAVDMILSNDGAAPMDITWAQMADGTQNLSLQIMAPGWFGPEWTDISNIYSPWAFPTPTYTILPGDNLAVRAVFYPGTPGDFQDELVLTTSIGEKRILFKGTGYNPPVMNIDNSPISVSMNTTAETESHSIPFDNISGQSDLDYEISVEYNRVAPANTNSEKLASGTSQKNQLLSIKAEKSLSASVLSAYNRTIRYTAKDVADNFVGTGGGAPFTLATKFNAGPQGFNLSHIETWFRTEGLDKGTIQVEVRAGGTSITDAIPVASGSLDFTGSGNDAKGAWYAVAMSKAAAIYPNEDFYVLVTFPMDLSYPQGTVNDEVTIAGRYYYEDEGMWYNIQDIPGFAKFGWLMYAAEATPGNSSWLSITSSLSGKLAMGDTSSTKIVMQGTIAARGDQKANIVFKTNDPDHAVVKVPVLLHMNEAPAFSGIPSVIQVAEKDTLVLNISVVDKEGNAFTTQAAQTYKGVTYAYADGILTIVMMPDYGDAGNYQYVFTATDEFNAVSQLTLPVEVIHTNRAPQYIATADPFKSFKRGTLKEFALTDLFKDPDGDVMTYTAVSSEPGVVEVFSSAVSFYAQAKSPGQTNITFTVSDNNGGQIVKILPVTIDVILGDIHFASENFYATPNPTSGKLTVIIPASDGGRISILNSVGVEITGVTVEPGVTNYPVNIEGEATGLYLVMLNDGKTKKAIRIIKN